MTPELREKLAAIDDELCDIYMTIPSEIIKRHLLKAIHRLRDTYDG